MMNTFLIKDLGDYQIVGRIIERGMVYGFKIKNTDYLLLTYANHGDNIMDYIKDSFFFPMTFYKNFPLSIFKRGNHVINLGAIKVFFNQEFEDVIRLAEHSLTQLDFKTFLKAEDIYYWDEYEFETFKIHLTEEGIIYYCYAIEEKFNEEIMTQLPIRVEFQGSVESILSVVFRYRINFSVNIPFGRFSEITVVREYKNGIMRVLTCSELKRLIETLNDDLLLMFLENQEFEYYIEMEEPEDNETIDQIETDRLIALSLQNEYNNSMSPNINVISNEDTGIKINVIDVDLTSTESSNEDWDYPMSDNEEVNLEGNFDNEENEKEFQRIFANEQFKVKSSGVENVYDYNTAIKIIIYLLETDAYFETDFPLGAINKNVNKFQISTWSNDISIVCSELIFELVELKSESNFNDFLDWLDKNMFKYELFETEDSNDEPDLNPKDKQLLEKKKREEILRKELDQKVEVKYNEGSPWDVSMSPEQIQIFVEKQEEILQMRAEEDARRKIERDLLNAKREKNRKDLLNEIAEASSLDVESIQWSLSENQTEKDLKKAEKDQETFYLISNNRYALLMTHNQEDIDRILQEQKNKNNGLKQKTIKLPDLNEKREPLTYDNYKNNYNGYFDHKFNWISSYEACEYDPMDIERQDHYSYSEKFISKIRERYRDEYNTLMGSSERCQLYRKIYVDYIRNNVLIQRKKLDTVYLFELYWPKDDDLLTIRPYERMKYNDSSKLRKTNIMTLSHISDYKIGLDKILNILLEEVGAFQYPSFDHFCAVSYCKEDTFSSDPSYSISLNPLKKDVNFMDAVKVIRDAESKHVNEILSILSDLGINEDVERTIRGVKRMIFLRHEVLSEHFSNRFMLPSVEESIISRLKELGITDHSVTVYQTPDCVIRLNGRVIIIDFAVSKTPKMVKRLKKTKYGPRIIEIGEGTIIIPLVCDEAGMDLEALESELIRETGMIPITSDMFSTEKTSELIKSITSVINFVVKNHKNSALVISSIYDLGDLGVLNVEMPDNYEAVIDKFWHNNFRTKEEAMDFYNAQGKYKGFDSPELTDDDLSLMDQYILEAKKTILFSHYNKDDIQQYIKPSYLKQNLVDYYFDGLEKENPGDGIDSHIKSNTRKNIVRIPFCDYTPNENVHNDLYNHTINFLSCQLQGNMWKSSMVQDLLRYMKGMNTNKIQEFNGSSEISEIPREYVEAIDRLSIHKNSDVQALREESFSKEDFDNEMKKINLKYKGEIESIKKRFKITGKKMRGQLSKLSFSETVRNELAKSGVGAFMTNEQRLQRRMKLTQQEDNFYLNKDYDSSDVERLIRLMVEDTESEREFSPDFVREMLLKPEIFPGGDFECNNLSFEESKKFLDPFMNTTSYEMSCILERFASDIAFKCSTPSSHVQISAMRLNNVLILIMPGEGLLGKGEKRRSVVFLMRNLDERKKEMNEIAIKNIEQISDNLWVSSPLTFGLEDIRSYLRCESKVVTSTLELLMESSYSKNTSDIDQEDFFEYAGFLPLVIFSDRQEESMNLQTMRYAYMGALSYYCDLLNVVKKKFHTACRSRLNHWFMKKSLGKLNNIAMMGYKEYISTYKSIYDNKGMLKEESKGVKVRLPKLYSEGDHNSVTGFISEIYFSNAYNKYKKRDLHASISVYRKYFAKEGDFRDLIASNVDYAYGMPEEEGMEAENNLLVKIMKGKRFFQSHLRFINISMKLFMKKVGHGWIKDLYHSSLFDLIITLMKTAGMVLERAEIGDDISKADVRSKVSLIIMKKMRDQIEAGNGDMKIIDFCTNFINNENIIPYNNLVSKDQIGGPRDITIQDFETRLSNLLLEEIAKSLLKNDDIDMSFKDRKFMIQNSYVLNVSARKFKYGGKFWFGNEDCSKWGPNMRCNIFASMFNVFSSYSNLGKYGILQSMKMMNKKMGFPKMIRIQWGEALALLEMKKSEYESITDPVEKKIKEEELRKLEEWIKSHDILGHMDMSETFLIPWDIVASSMGQGILHLWSSVYHSAGCNLSVVLIKKIFELDNNNSALYVQTTSDDVGKYWWVNTNKSILSRNNCIPFLTLIDDYHNRCQGYLKSDEKSSQSALSEFNSNFIVGKVPVIPKIKHNFVASSLIPDSYSVQTFYSSMISAIRDYLMHQGYLSVCFVMMCYFFDFRHITFSTYKNGYNDLNRIFNLNSFEVPYQLGGFPVLSPLSLHWGLRYSNYAQLKNCGIETELLLRNIYSNKFFTSSDVSLMQGTYYSDDPLVNGLTISFSLTADIDVDRIRKDFYIKSVDDAAKLRTDNPLTMFLPITDPLIALQNAEAVFFSTSRIDALENRNAMKNFLRIFTMTRGRKCGIGRTNKLKFSECLELVRDTHVKDYNIEDYLSYNGSTIDKVFNIISNLKPLKNNDKVSKIWNRYFSSFSYVTIQEASIHLMNTFPTILLNKWFNEDRYLKVFPSRLREPKWLDNDWSQITSAFPWIKNTFEETMSVFHQSDETNEEYSTELQELFREKEAVSDEDKKLILRAKIIGDIIKFANMMQSRRLKVYTPRIVTESLRDTIIAMFEFQTVPNFRIPTSFIDKTSFSKMMRKDNTSMLIKIKQIMSFAALVKGANIKRSSLIKVFERATYNNESLKSILQNINEVNINEIGLEKKEKENLIAIIITIFPESDFKSSIISDDEVYHHFNPKRKKINGRYRGNFMMYIYNQKGHLKVFYNESKFLRLEYPFRFEALINEGYSYIHTLNIFLLYFHKKMHSMGAVCSSSYIESLVFNHNDSRQKRKNYQLYKAESNFKITPNNIRVNDRTIRIYSSNVEKIKMESNIDSIDFSYMENCFIARIDGENKKLKNMFFRYYMDPVNINFDGKIGSVDFSLMIETGLLQDSEVSIATIIKSKFRNNEKGILMFLEENFSEYFDLDKYTNAKLEKMIFMGNKFRRIFKEFTDDDVPDQDVILEKEKIEDDDASRSIAFSIQNVRQGDIQDVDYNDSSSESLSDEDFVEPDDYLILEYDERYEIAFSKSYLEFRSFINSKIRSIIWSILNSNKLNEFFISKDAVHCAISASILHQNLNSELPSRDVYEMRFALNNLSVIDPWYNKRVYKYDAECFHTLTHNLGLISEEQIRENKMKIIEDLNNELSFNYYLSTIMNLKILMNTILSFSETKVRIERRFTIDDI